MDLETREVHSMTRQHNGHAKDWPRLLLEHDNAIRLIFKSGFEPASIVISSEDARYLARTLNRLALRLERRADARSGSMGDAQ